MGKLKIESERSCINEEYRKVYWETIISGDDIIKGKIVCKGLFNYIHTTCLYNISSEGLMVINIQVNSILGLLRCKVYINKIIDYIFKEYEHVKKINIFILEIETFAIKIIDRTKLELEVRYIDSIKYNGVTMDYIMYGVIRND